MQRQQEREPAPIHADRRGRRGLWEMLAACLLVLWGTGTACLVGSWLLEVVRGNHLPTSARDLPMVLFLGTFQGVFCAVGGLGTLLKNRVLAKLLLMTAALCCLGLAGFACIEGFFIFDKFLWCLISLSFLSIATLLFSLGRWLGHQEDIEE